MNGYGRVGRSRIENETYAAEVVAATAGGEIVAMIE